MLLPVLIVALQAAEPGMVFIPGGEFQRGRTFEWADYDVKYYPRSHQDDRPVRKISIDAFYLDESEVTNAKYAAFAKAHKHRVPYHWRKGQFPEGKEQHPVSNVSWDDAVAYCSAQGKRLPTEAEWERAARGLAEGRMFPWGDKNPTAKQARFNTDSTIAVCATERNSFGLCDMIGNVWEWTADWYGRTYYEEAPEKNPTGPATGMYRVLRGGSYFDEPPLFLTVSYRSWARPAERSATIGFRCAKGFRK